MEIILLIFAAIVLGSWASVMVAFTHLLTAFTNRIKIKPEEPAEAEETAEERRAREMEKAFQSGLTEILNYDMSIAHKAGESIGEK